jgi:hypothetical protein
MSENSVERSALITHTSDIVVAHISRHAVQTAELPGLIETVFNTLSGLGAPAAEFEVEQKLAVVDDLFQIKGDLDSSPSGDRKLLRLLRGFREQLEHHKGAGISAR